MADKSTTERLLSVQGRSLVVEVKEHPAGEA